MTARIAILALCMLTPICTARVARGDDTASAQQLFDEARRLIKEGTYPEACAKLEESQRIDPGIGTLYNLADCNEHIGKTATAWAQFRYVASQTKTEHQAARERVARQRATALEPRLSRMTILVRSTDRDLKLERNGVEIGHAQWGSAIPVDPGDHMIVASAPGKQSWHRSVHVYADAQTVPVEIATLDPAPAAATPIPTPTPTPTPTSAPAPSAASNGGPSAAPTASPMGTRPVPAAPAPTSAGRTIAGLMIGAALVGAGVGATFAVMSKMRHDDANPHCASNICDPTGVRMRQDAVRDGNIATIAFVSAGGALLGGTVLWFAAAPSSKTAGPSAMVGIQGAL